MNSDDFVQTLEHRRFVEFSDACRRYRYIGLCYGPPGVGKTISARRMSSAGTVEKHDPWRDEPVYGLPHATVFYTAAVVNSPQQIVGEIARAREKLTTMARGPLRRQAEIALHATRLRNESYQRAHWDKPGYQPGQEPSPTYREVAEEYEAKKRAITDPTTLIVIDEADRLRMPTLEQARAIFDQAAGKGGFGLILIGMPGIEKRMARYPQFYSRIGFVHEFRPLGEAEMRRLIERRWAPGGVNLPALSEEAAASAMRITGGNFRLLNRLFAQIERVLEINGLAGVTQQVVEAARESLVIGQA
jgi:hypothetical protein